MRRLLTATAVSIGISLALLACPVEAQQTASGSGTGFFVNEEGWLVTNAHVVENCSRVVIVGFGKVTDQKIDRQNDLAALKIVTRRSLSPLQLRRAPARLGEDVAAMGYPLSGMLSETVKITTGNVNSLVGINNDARYLQISTPIQPGNSGGPLFDESGAVMGVTTATLARSVGDSANFIAQNVNFALRSNLVELFLQSRGIEFVTANANSERLKTPDLAEKAAPSVVQVICHGDGKLLATEVPEPAGPSASPSPDAEHSAEDLAVAIVLAYSDAWSSPNPAALDFMRRIYKDSTFFYGSQLSAEAVMQEKSKFAERWAIRHYSIRDGSLEAFCRGSKCTVTSLIDWFAHSEAREKSSNGVATFELDLDLVELSIKRESGTVLRDRKADPSAMLTRWHELNGKCRGGSGDAAETQQACEARSHVDRSISAAGWCYGRHGELAYQMEWHKCGRSSLR